MPLGRRSLLRLNARGGAQEIAHRDRLNLLDQPSGHRLFLRQNVLTHCFGQRVAAADGRRNERRAGDAILRFRRHSSCDFASASTVLSVNSMPALPVPMIRRLARSIESVDPLPFARRSIVDSTVGPPFTPGLAEPALLALPNSRAWVCAFGATLQLAASACVHVYRAAPDDKDKCASGPSEP
jgi:hypothetical protein